MTWVNVPILSSDTSLDVKAKSAFVYNKDTSIATVAENGAIPVEPIGPKPNYANISVNDTLGTATLPTTTNRKVLVSKTETVGQGNQETFTFNGTAELSHSHLFGTVTYVVM